MQVFFILPQRLAKDKKYAFLLTFKTISLYFAINGGYNQWILKKEQDIYSAEF